ncbi:hypothetical protein [Sphingomonas sp.]|uniref:hypothetical protein n=1 Tax=Sphingomonas sp. TaxID=28214 RepID=UPI003D6C7D4D
MTMPWDWEALQRKFSRHAALKRQGADRCQSQVRNGKTDYKRFHDEDLAEHMMATFLSTSAALTSRDALLTQLADLQESVADGRHDAEGMYNAKHYRQAARKYLNTLIGDFAGQ